MSTKSSRQPAKKALLRKRVARRAVGAGLILSRAQAPRLSVRELRERFGVNRKVFSRVVGFSERAIADWEADKPLSGISLQRMREMNRLQQGLANVMQSDYIATWLNAPNAAFDGLKPLEVIERGEIDRLWRMIYQLESGIPL